LKKVVINLLETHEHDGRYPVNPKNKELAVKQMKLFIQLAQEALKKLESLTLITILLTKFEYNRAL